MSRVSRRQFLSRVAVTLGVAPVLLSTACQQAAAPAPSPAATTKPAPAAPTSAPPQATQAPAPTQAPAGFKGTTLSILGGTYFIAPAQDLFKKQCEDWGKENGVTMRTDFLNWPDLQPKIGAAVQAGGLDIVELWPTWCFLYEQSLVDLTDLSNKVAQNGGGFEEYVVTSSKVGDRYMALPIGNSGTSLNYRLSVFREAGIDVPSPEDQAKNGTWPDLTWDEFWEVGKKSKAKGLPIGQALGHSTGDPQSFAYPFMWSNGAMEVEEDGKTVAFDKPAFVDAMTRFVTAWKECYDETGTSWDDSNNNRAFISEQICATLNGSSIYYAAKKDAPEVADDMSHALIPKGSAGRFYNLGSRTMGILGNSKNVEAAKAFLEWWSGDGPFGDWLHIQEGYQMGNTKKWTDDPMWLQDPKISVYRENPKYGRSPGYAGPTNEQSSLAWSKYIVVDTCSKAVQSGDAAGSVQWGADQLERIYGG